jgi:bifunctional DNA-binding transcriptional regulator/antitoxin component of YhaV-PrlF toxin-antitoxin module
MKLPYRSILIAAKPKETVMKRVLISLIPVLVAVVIIAFPFPSSAQNRERFLISARAGGVNAVTGRAAVRAHGNGDWQQLTIQEDLEAGDVVRTGLGGRVEMLLNPGSYLRVGENTEIELTDNSLENLEVRLVRGTAIVEVTGADDTELLINITTPQTRMAIVRRGLYRVNVIPGDSTELIVRKGRVMLDRTHTKIKGGDKVVFSENSFSVAKLKKSDKTRDDLEAWSQDRGEKLARANNRLSMRALSSLTASNGTDWWLANFSGRAGVWLFDPAGGFFTFFPFSYGWGSPYGTFYGSSLYGTIYGLAGNPASGWYPASGSSAAGNGNGSSAGTGSGAGTSNNPSPMPASRISEAPARSAGSTNARRPNLP